MSSSTDSRVLAILARVVRRDASTLKPTQDLASDLDVNSASALELLSTLEEELSIEISEVEAAKLRTVGDVLAFVASKSKV